MTRKTIFISLIGHITVFSIFSFSFGNSVPQLNYPYVSFRGAFLGNSELAHSQKNIFISRRNTAYYLPARLEYSLLLSDWQRKPQLSFAFNPEKQVFMEKSQPLPVSSKRKEDALLFHPLLPYSFTLYFKDRQVAHVELMFNIISKGVRNSIAIKRKISSGNLEVDLLVKRYIGHYLFIQQNRFPADTWQTVKIDLSAKEN